MSMRAIRLSRTQNGGDDRGDGKRNDDSEGNGDIGEFSVTLSCDHRVHDGVVGAVWLQHFENLEEHRNSIHENMKHCWHNGYLLLHTQDIYRFPSSLF